jgi:hypothetical protein
MSKSLKEKQELEQKIWAILRLEGKVPSNTTKEGHAKYKQLKRDVQRQVAVKYPSFWQFLRDYDATKQDVIDLFNSEMVFEDMWGPNAFRFRKKKR